ncbi:MAG: DUF2934 domain-containing protein [Thiobacillaceae bacterium]
MSANKQHMEARHKAGTAPLADAEAAELHQQVAALAYLKAEVRRFLPGHELDDWLEAEMELSNPTSHTPTH